MFQRLLNTPLLVHFKFSSKLSFPKEILSEMQLNNLPTTEGSKSTNTDFGTCFPEDVSLKKKLKESSPPPKVVALGI